MKKMFAVMLEVLGAVLFGMLVGNVDLELKDGVILGVAILIMAVEILIHMGNREHPIMLGLTNFAFLFVILPYIPAAYEQITLANYIPVTVLILLSAIVVGEVLVYLGGYIREKIHTQRAEEALRTVEEAEKNK